LQGFCLAPGPGPDEKADDERSNWGSFPSLTERLQEWNTAAVAVRLAFHKTACSGGNGTQC